MSSSSTDVSRRAFLRAAGGVALGAAAVPILAACGVGAPASSPGTASGSRSAAAPSGGKVKLPTYVALPNLPSPDLPGSTDGLLAPGYQKYPTNLIRSVSQPPGKGGEVNALTASLSTAPTPLENNPAWQQVNTELGVTLKIPSIS